MTTILKYKHNYLSQTGAPRQIRTYAHTIKNIHLLHSVSSNVKTFRSIYKIHVSNADITHINILNRVMHIKQDSYNLISSQQW